MGRSQLWSSTGEFLDWKLLRHSMAWIRGSVIGIALFSSPSMGFARKLLWNRLLLVFSEVGCFLTCALVRIELVGCSMIFPLHQCRVMYSQLRIVIRSLILCCCRLCWRRGKRSFYLAFPIPLPFNTCYKADRFVLNWLKLRNLSLATRDRCC